MGKLLDGIDQDLRTFLEAQPVFFVATAPLAVNGHVNLSPRGLDTFRVLGSREVAWLDLTGSGNETAAHLGENGRIALMWCAFSGPPRIVRLHGRGEVVRPGYPGWAEASAPFPDLPGVRQVVRVRVERVSTSCGFGVPLMEPIGDRDTLLRWAERKGEDGLVAYRREKNARSVDGLPGGFEVEGTS